MKFLTKGLIVIIAAVISMGCEGDYRKRAIGGFSEAVVLMDSTMWDSSATSQAIRDTYGQAIKTMPNYEAMFDLRFRDFSNNDELEALKRNKNIIIAAPINDSSEVSRLIRAMLDDEVEERVKEGESFAFPLQDHWYKDQWTIILSSTSDSALAEEIRASSETLVDNLMEKEFQRWTYEIYDDGEQYELEDSLWTNHGWKIRIQHDWIKNVDTTYSANGRANYFLTMRRPLPDNDRWFWAWWIDDVEDPGFIDSEWINAKRDSLMEKWIRGTREDSYVTTEYRRPVNTDMLTLDGHKAYETLGTWRMTNDAMGGPFANMTVYDEEQERLFILEFGQFAPRYSKRRFVRQFRTMLRTFESDSTWSGSSSNQAVAQN